MMPAAVLVLIGALYAPGRLFAFLTAGAFLALAAARAWRRGNRWPALGVVAMIAAAALLAHCAATDIRRLRDARNAAPPPLHGVDEGEADGLRGPIRVRVEHLGQFVFDVQVLSCADSPSIAGEALEETRRRIIKDQTPYIPPAPGARESTAALCRAVESALFAGKEPEFHDVTFVALWLESNVPRPRTFATLIIFVITFAAMIGMQRFAR